MLSHDSVLLITTTTTIPYNNASASVSHIHGLYIVPLTFSHFIIDRCHLYLYINNKITLHF